MTTFLIVLVSLLLAVIAIGSVLYFRSRRRHRRKMEQLQLQNRAHERLRELIQERAGIMERMLVAAISGSSEYSDAAFVELERLVSDREDFMSETRRIYESWQPEMIARLQACGLDDREIEICGLYALGLNGKTIQRYPQDGRHYQNVGLSRKKLGLGEHDKNIDGYIKSLMK